MKPGEAKTEAQYNKAVKEQSLIKLRLEFKHHIKLAYRCLVMINSIQKIDKTPQTTSKLQFIINWWKIE